LPRLRRKPLPSSLALAYIIHHNTQHITTQLHGSTCCCFCPKLGMQFVCKEVC
jgi:hypothetical protein